MKAIILMTTYPNKGRELSRFVKAILGSGLAKCVQRINYMKSYYIREGELKKEEEKLLLIKTIEDKKEKLITFIKSQHPYEVPEIMIIHPDEVDESYLTWLGTEEKFEKKKKKKESQKKGKEKKENKRKKK